MKRGWKWKRGGVYLLLVGRFDLKAVQKRTRAGVSSRSGGRGSGVAVLSSLAESAFTCDQKRTHTSAMRGQAVGAGDRAFYYRRQDVAGFLIELRQQTLVVQSQLVQLLFQTAHLVGRRRRSRPLHRLRFGLVEDDVVVALSLEQRVLILQILHFGPGLIQLTLPIGHVHWTPKVPLEIELGSFLDLITVGLSKFK